METATGYAKTGLIKFLKTAQWTECGPDDQNFSELGLGGYCLTRPADRLCNTKFRVTVKDEAGNTFSTIGFCYPDMPRTMQLETEDNIIGHVPLQKKKSKKAPCLYTITVKII